MAISQMIGARIQRREDPRLVSGHGRYVDDHSPTGTLHMAIVRSPHAHARVRGIETAAAAASAGGAAVYTAADFNKVLRGYLPAPPTVLPEKKEGPDQFPIAAAGGL